MGDTFTVMVKWRDAPRAERLGNGSTTTRKVHAVIFRSREDADRGARQALTDLPPESAGNLDRWWVAPF